MKVNHVRTLAARSALCAAPLATLVLGFCLQACGGVGPDGEPAPGEPQSTTPAEVKPGPSEADLKILGITVPQPTITFGLGDASTKIDPIGTIDTVIPEQGIALPDPFQPVNNILTNLGKPISASVGNNDVGVSIKLPPLLPPELGSILTGLDPFADAGIPLIGQ